MYRYRSLLQDARETMLKGPTSSATHTARPDAARREPPMSRIAALDPAQTEGNTHEMLAGVNKMLGVIPNLFRVTAQSPAALEALLALLGATGRGALDARTRGSIALTVAETNGCDYCLSAHTVLGRGTGLSDADMERARDAVADDPKRAATLRFARAIVAERGKVSADDLAAARSAGLSDGQLLDVVTNVVLNVFTNYVNLIAETEIDFPVIATKKR
jgi:uncharacterized peroxidase-related enzyme